MTISASTRVKTGLRRWNRYMDEYSCELQEKGGMNPVRTTIYKATMYFHQSRVTNRYIMLTGCESIDTIIARSMASQLSSVVYDAINKCIGYYRELGSESRIAVRSSRTALWKDAPVLQLRVQNPFSVYRAHHHSSPFSREHGSSPSRFSRNAATSATRTCG